jgi:hypothetical protein
LKHRFAYSADVNRDSADVNNPTERRDADELMMPEIIHIVNTKVKIWLLAGDGGVGQGDGI